MKSDSLAFDEMRLERRHLAETWGLAEDDITITVRLPDRVTLILGPTAEEIEARRTAAAEAQP